MRQEGRRRYPGGMTARKQPKPDKRKPRPKPSPPAKPKPKPKPKKPARPAPKAKPRPRAKPTPPPAKASARSRVKAKPPQAPAPAAPANPRDYEAHKARARDRNARLSRSGRDIGPIPPVADKARRERCERDLLAFLNTYFGHIFTLPWCPDHLTVIAQTQQSVLLGGLFGTAMPRGSGKTSVLECACLWSILYGHRPFVVLIGSDASHAEQMLESIKVEIETNDLLADDFPEVCHAVTSLEGINNRAAGQIANGERTCITWTDKVIVLPTIAGSKASGCVVKAAGLTSSIRGMKHKRADGTTIRPSLVFCDDIQTEASANSATQCVSRERILSGAILGLAGPGQKIAGLLAATVIRAGDVADNLLDRRRHPEWNGTRIAALKAFPTNDKLWQTYAELRAEGLRQGQGLAAATKFYAENRAAMDAGAVPYWPERFNSDDELSAVQNLMNLFLQDEEAFWAEMQNAPKDLTKIEQELITVDHVLSRINRLGRGVLPLASTHVTAFIDVQGTLLYYLVLAVADDFTGAVVDYGGWPDQQRTYWALRDARPTLQDRAKGAGLEGAIYAGLTGLCADLLGREWKRESGDVARISRVMIDANWGASTDTVYQFCRQSGHAALLLPSHGKYFGASATPISQYQQRPGERLGFNWRITSGQGKRAIKHVVYDSNSMKSFLAARLRTAIGDKGAIAVWGDKPDRHRMLAEHLTSEVPIKTEARGRSVDEWRLIPGRENHLLDCLVGACVAASIQGASLMGDGPPKKRVKLSDLQKAKRGR